MPIIVLSVRAQENDKVAALDAGADDYQLGHGHVPWSRYQGTKVSKTMSSIDRGPTHRASGAARKAAPVGYVKLR